MNGLMRRGSNNLLDEFFREFTPGFFVQPLHGDPLPVQIRVDVQEGKDAIVVQAELPVARTLQLPADIDEAKAKARYENGVLKLTLPKKAGGRLQRLTVE